MSYVRRKGEKDRYWMVDRQCIGRDCFAPGRFQHRSATMGGGSRNTGDYSLTCMRNAYHGCPDCKDQLYSVTELLKNTQAGWKNC